MLETSVVSAIVRFVRETSAYTLLVGSWIVSWSKAGSLETEVLCCFGVIPGDVVKKVLNEDSSCPFLFQSCGASRFTRV